MARWRHTTLITVLAAAIALGMVASPATAGTPQNSAPRSIASQDDPHVQPFGPYHDNERFWGHRHGNGYVGPFGHTGHHFYSCQTWEHHQCWW